MLTADAAVWCNHLKARQRVCYRQGTGSKRGKGTRKEREKGGLWGLTSIQRFSFISWHYSQLSEGKDGIKVTHSMLFFFLSELFSSDLVEVWRVKKTEVWGGQSTSSRRCVERWRGQSNCWWPRPPHGGSVAVAGGCCCYIDGELRSDGKRKTAEFDLKSSDWIWVK